ncbi:hypothetical protein DL765_010496 [Monosporascus sp. GIB2]|nr:hypothetical protein DL765_010496 [Monosporascus sp. GIB2]
MTLNGRNAIVCPLCGHLISSPSTLASMNNLGLVLRRQGKYEEAEQMHRQALQLQEKVLGREHPSTARNRKNLADCLAAKTRS